MLVIGGGFGGLLAGARLREAGVEPGEIRIVEKGGDFGGTWYWNRYPGAMCDIESYIYLPLLEELGYVPKEKYTHAPEILAHSRAIGEHFGLYDNALFQTEVTDMRWDDDGRSLDRGDQSRRRDARSLRDLVEWAVAPRQAARHPRHRRTFKGHSFHTSRWDYALHRRRPRGRPHRSRETSASASSAPAPPRSSACPTWGSGRSISIVFQRTPSSVDVRNNRDTDPEWARSLQPGWQKHRMENFNALVTGGFADEDLVKRRLDRHHRQAPAHAAGRATT